MYLKHYNLKEKPFDINPNPRHSLSGEKHSKAFTRLKYGITANKGLLLLTGDSGMGKTGLINRLIREFESETIITTIPHPRLKIIDFFRTLSVGFKLNQKFNNQSEIIIELKNFLHKSADKKVLLIIYEAQEMSFDLLEQIRILSNIELPYRKLINIFFVGQTEFLDILRDKRSRAIRQRIAIKCHLEPLNRKETELYIRKRIEIAGGKHEIFSLDAIQEIFSFSKGNPRFINIICDNALVSGYACRLKVIGAEVIKECSKKLSSNLGSEKDQSDIKESKEKRELFAAETTLENLETPNIDSEENRLELEEVEDKHESSISWENLETAEAPDIDAEQDRSQGKLIAILSFISFSLIIVGYFLFGFNTNDETSWSKQEFAFQKLPETSISETKVQTDNQKEPIGTNEATTIKESPESKGKIQQPDQLDATIAEAEVKADNQEEPIGTNEATTIKESPESKEKIQQPDQLDATIAEAEVKPDNQEEPRGTSEATTIKESPESKGKIQQPDQVDATLAEAEVQTDNQGEPSGANESKQIEESPMPYEILAHTNEVKPSHRAEKQGESLNKIQNGKSYVKQIKIIYFKHNSNELPSDAIDELDEVSKTVSNYPDSEIKIEGYTDSFGDYSFNEQLSFFRANVVRTYFLARGIPATRISTFGMGPKNPIASNETLEGRKKNRRVEISIIMK